MRVFCKTACYHSSRLKDIPKRGLIYQNRDEALVPPFKHSFDVVYGPIANDRVGLQIRNYRLGNIDKKEFLRRLHYMKGITFQYAFCTEKAIQKLKHNECK